MQQLSEKDLEEKVALLTSIEQYRIWPHQTLQKLALALEWVRYPPASSTPPPLFVSTTNTSGGVRIYSYCICIVLTTEGIPAPFVAYVKSGTCRVFRMVAARTKLENGREVRPASFRCSLES